MKAIQSCLMNQLTLAGSWLNFYGLRKSNFRNHSATWMRGYPRRKAVTGGWELEHIFQMQSSAFVNFYRLHNIVCKIIKLYTNDFSIKNIKRELSLRINGNESSMMNWGLRISICIHTPVSATLDSYTSVCEWIFGGGWRGRWCRLTPTFPSGQPRLWS